MTYLPWTSDLETGIVSIDDQHRKLIDYINELHDACDTHSQEKIGAVIEKLIDYTVLHFADEEKMMEDAGYPLSDHHIRIHRTFVERMQEIQKDYLAGRVVDEELMRLMQKWMFTHIQHHDRGFVDRLQNRVTGG